MKPVLSVLLLVLPALLGGCGSPHLSDAPDATAGPEGSGEPSSPGGSDEAGSRGGSWRQALDGELREAYDVLRSTQRFTDGAIYAAGVTPREVIALRLLTRHAEGAAILDELFRNGSEATKLYALSGLWHLDRRRFEQGVETLRGTEAVVEYQTGCLRHPAFPVAELLDQGSDHAVRLDAPGQTIRAWKAEDPARASLGYDVVGGGFPDLFLDGGGYGELAELRLADGVD